MLAAGIEIRAILARDRADWLSMWQAYCAFYEVEIPEPVTRSTWNRLVAGDTAIHGLIAMDAASNAALGFAHYVVHPFTWSEFPACYLEDLFVHPATRGKGVGAALIERLIALGRRHRWARIYWMTRETNVVARRLYDRFGQRDDFVRYDIAIDSARPQQ